MRSDWAIRADHVGKQFMLGEREQYLALRDVIASAGARLIGRKRHGDAAQQMRWALEDISFEIEPGEVVGLIGRNGAGKSTLLKLISSITRPTTGSVSVRGRIGTLLEVGNGFHPELTGNENIFLNGAILGMRRQEILANFDDIVEFSGVAPFLDTPVKRYSTGMFMRLAFAVAAYLDTEILLVDEVLAVGDAEFQRKCIGRMSELSQDRGRAVVFVSHSDAAIRQLCTRSIWIEEGHVRMDGRTDEVLPRYLDEQFRHATLGEWLDVPDRTRRGSGEAKFSHIRLEVPGAPEARAVPTGAPLRIRARIHADEPVTCGNISFHIGTLGGLKLLEVGHAPADGVVELPAGDSEIEIVVDSVSLNPGRYTGALWMSRPTGATNDYSLFDHVADATDVVVASPDGENPDAVIAAESTFRTASPASE